MTTWIKDFLLLTLIIGTFFGATLGRYPLAAPDGARYAEIPREMVVTGDYVTPHLNGVKYFEKPPLFYWMQATSFKLFGINELSASLANALVALGCALLMYLTGRKLYGRLAGILGSFVFATTSLVFALTRVVTLDFAFTFFFTGSMCSFLLANQLDPGKKRTLYFWLMYVFAACAVMTKGLIGIVLPGMIGVAWLTVCNEWRKVKTYHLISGTIIFLIIALPWHILVQIRNTEFFDFYFIKEHFLRYFTSYAHRSQKWWFLPVLVLAGLLPWITFIPQTIGHSISKTIHNLKESKETIFLLLWITVIYIFYTFSSSQLIPYILPIFPAIAMLAGRYFADEITKNSRPLKIGFYALAAFNALLAITALIATFVLDFKEQSFTQQNLYVVAAIILIGTLITLFAHRRHGTIPGFVAITICISCLWLYLSPIITKINRQSIKPLIITLQKELKPENEVISFGRYFQELPFYLNRIVTIADFRGELSFGIDHGDTSSWMIDMKAFWERWNSEELKYMLLTKKAYHRLQPDAPNKMRIVDKLWDVLLVANIK